MGDGFARLKWRWLDMLMHDGSLPPAYRCVGFEIARRLNSATGDAWPSQGRIARDLHLDVKTVKRALAALAGEPATRGGPRRRCYLKISREPGRPGSRRVHNSYVPRFEALSEGPIHGNTPPTLGAEIPDELGNTPPIVGGLNPVIGGLMPPVIGGQNGPVTSPSRTSQEKTAVAAEAATGDEAVWQAILNTVAARTSPSIVDAWFDAVLFEDLSGGGLTLSVPSKFLAKEIENRFRRHLLIAAQQQQPNAERLVINVWGSRAVAP